MKRIDRVVWKGKFIKPNRVPIGRLVYRNDYPFLKQRGKIIRIQWFAIIVALAAILFFMTGLGQMGFFSLVIFWIIMLAMDIVQLNMWRGMDRGMVVHENGVDSLDYRAFTLGRVFVPWEEISHIGIGWFRFTIFLKASKKKVFCHRNMVDVDTVWHTGRLLEGWIPEQREPEMVIYSEDGASRSMPQFRM